MIDGKRDQLVGKLQEKYGIAKNEAEKQLDSWLAAQDATTDAPVRR